MTGAIYKQAFYSEAKLIYSLISNLKKTITSVLDDSNFLPVYSLNNTFKLK